MKRLALLTLVVLVLTGCADTMNGVSIAEPEVAVFRERLKARDYDAIFESAHAQFQSAVDRDKLFALFGALERKLGPLQESQQTNWNVNTHNFTTTVVMVYSSKFRDGEATETFVFRVDDGVATLIRYNIDSPDLLIS